MSDRQKGLVDAIQTCWPNASVRHCARHVYANFRKKFPGLRLRNLFWAFSKAANIIDFQQAMEKIKAIDREGHRWMIENDVRSWSRHAFNLDSKSDHVTNNMCEVFSSWLGENRELPILSLLEHHRRRVMVQMQAKAKARVTTIPSNIHRKINDLIELAKNVEVIWPRGAEFEVVDNNCFLSRCYILNLQPQTCDCGMWQLSRVPCVHAVHCLLFRNIRNMKDYVDSSLRITSYNLLSLTFVFFALFREKKLYQPQQVRHVNIEATVKGSRY
ncbi:uncharacterized protein LOC116109573 [Pistacia vera]|uniref:uncharacterized protein LOC116109573 n=1 Tax=Pistacia vera TaxID=55513 RepID=UPI001262D6C4|nr:uncharacterized protein LOC116109573 [Pistacia vera]